MNAILVNIAIKVNYVNRNCKLLNFQVKKIFGLLKIKVATQPISMAHGVTFWIIKRNNKMSLYK